jgi:hypothetical protein
VTTQPCVNVRDPLAVTFHLRTDEHVNATSVSVSVSKYSELLWSAVNAHEPKALQIGTS